MGFEVIDKSHIFAPKRFFPQCHASTVLALNDGEVLAAWFGGTHENDADVAIWCSRKKNGRWFDPLKVADKSGVACWNPVLHSGSNGRLTLYYKVGINPRKWYTMAAESSDNGHTWSEPRELIKGDIGGRGPVKNKAITLLDNTILAPASIETDTAWDAFVDISKDEGISWIKSERIPLDRKNLNGKGIIQPTLWESQPNHVHMLLRSTEGAIYRSDSLNGGKTWCEAYPTGLPNNNSGIDVAKTENGKLVLVYNPVEGDWAERTPIVCAISDDNGNTWRDEYVL
ncbi:MAG: exo-alpha-sialidase, partial [Spirochaetales bacterium]|nr:exo-alpha-sialidase [Spirochaetales bacterium]